MTTSENRPDAGLPQLDEARRRLWLSPEHVEGLADAYRGQAPEPETAAQLRRSGLVDRTGAIHPLAANLARAGAEPLIHLGVEVVGPQGATFAHVIVHEQDVWTTDPWPTTRDGPRCYQLTELGTITFELARLVGLHQARPSQELGPARTTSGQFDALLTAFAHAGEAGGAQGRQLWDDVRTVAIATAGRELPDPDAEGTRRLITLITSLRSSWRITSVWAGAASGPVRALAALDCGEEGYWLRSEPGDPVPETPPAPGTPLRLDPVPAARLWAALADLLPSSTELREPAA